MKWVLQTVSNYGTSNRNVAQVVLQTQEIVAVTNLSRGDKDALFGATFGLANRLANAEAAALDIEARSKAAFEALEHNHERGPDAVEIPYLQGLDIMFEGFFYNAKNIVRDLGDVMRIIYGKRFAEASDWCAFGKRTQSEVSRYFRRLANEHPGYDAVRNLIENSREGIEMMVRIRNAVEHPGGSSGTIQLNNFRASTDGIATPRFFFVGDSVRYDVVLSLKQFHELLLDLVETVIVFGLMHRFAMPNVGVHRIPEKDRDPEKPVAFQLVEVTEEMRAGSASFDGRPVASA